MSLLSQDVAWFDEQNVGALITKLTEGVEKIEAGIGEKLGIFIQCIVIFISGLIIGFTKNWKLSLVGCAILPPIAIGFGLLGYLVRKFTAKTQRAYERANNIASEALGSIRTIFAFEGQKTELSRYTAELNEAEKVGIKMSTSIGGGRFMLHPLFQCDNFLLAFPFSNVSFAYPMRKQVKVLNNFSLNIKPGQTIALVGASGSGKSTVIQLIQRFYDANDGQIIIDGEDIRNLDLAWFRSQLGVVSQEPVLFAGTVTENIKLGALNASQEEVEEAAKLACVHDFVCKLPEAYNTFIAEGGGAMSGGQKQRLAIARALIRKPRILLLDEATSALDTKSEKSVQRALDNAKVGRTVVVVAHRLSTVRDADTIVVVNKGQVVEMGTHDQLMAIKDGQYASLVKTSVRHFIYLSKTPH
ncbi:unnamed protein product [Mesocestoides corti]|uniref:ABC transporter domain-containing protein n=1 Tax=Mesocestoides corti TaxID=53468 RepID=A0A0R3UNX6_MESCO|nr:unnamed protein product [Mesocestoides corti]